MDLEILRKKISTYKGDGGRASITSDELLIEILFAWEQWTGPASGFYKALGVSQKGISTIIGRAKKLRREGFPMDGFKEVKIEETPSNLTSLISKEPTDMRASYDTLFAKVKGVFNQDPYTGHLFVFINQRRTSIKCLFWDGTGFVLWQLCR